PAGREHAPAGREGARRQRIASRQALSRRSSRWADPSVGRPAGGPAGGRAGPPAHRRPHFTPATDVIELAGIITRAGLQRPDLASRERACTGWPRRSTQAADRIAAGTEPEVIAVGGPVGGQARRRTCPGTAGPAGTSTSAFHTSDGCD